MPLHTCSISTDATRRETTPQGTSAFPLACYSNHPAQLPVPWHWHDEFECIVLQEGTAIAAVDSQKTTLCSGEAIFINSGRLHSVSAAEGEPCHFISMVFHPRLVGGNADSIFWQKYLQPLMDHPLLPCLHITPDSDAAVQAIHAAERAWQCVTRETPGYEFEARSCLSTLIYQIKCMLPDAKTPSADRSRRDAERIKRMLSFIHERYADEISTREIAASASISESECLRCFHNSIDTTPIQYLRSYRIDQAAMLLGASNLRIAEIGAACGFQEMSYFAKAFREKHGCTPSEYRKQMKTTGLAGGFHCIIARICSFTHGISPEERMGIRP